ncbi:formyltetrahydrofolate deformylase [Rubidibacter lacunae KORDI 51-2]|uniref:Formyltetrahydrofolate deformylase n=1 Tax=Rubidibacter lacunae KORDI 51-2 TaxID=582515 RepID=U5DEN9_9CHRO|nr:formyltetrahydrofolate deformylase [Rubidibacter lacunae]ERN40076.1 formyltetrahydrofolate deformylase [Rubidibacter lacunae KORDI 51-2]
MSSTLPPTATILVSCPDRRGLVATLSGFIHANNGNIIHADHHTDRVQGVFLTRLEWSMDGFELERKAIEYEFSKLASELEASWQLHFSDSIPRLAIWVSKQEHCLLDLLWRHQSGELRATIPLIISNHRKLEPIAKQFEIDFHYIPIDKTNRGDRERQQLELLHKYDIDLVVLAKYMQILSPAFLAKFSRVINIHHSFLPAFPGAHPYRRAYQRGVKIVGATAHYVTEELDGGPIIDQEVIRVSHRDSEIDLIRKGKDVERIVLSKAVWLHLQNRVLEYNNRTVVFD